MHTQKFKIGDIITSYHKGYHKVTAFNGQPGMSSAGLVSYVTLNQKTLKFGTRERCCDQSYCALAKEHIEAEIENLQKVLACVLFSSTPPWKINTEDNNK